MWSTTCVLRSARSNQRKRNSMPPLRGWIWMRLCRVSTRSNACTLTVFQSSSSKRTCTFLPALVVRSKNATPSALRWTFSLARWPPPVLFASSHLPGGRHAHSCSLRFFPSSQAGDGAACRVDGLLARFVTVLDVSLVCDDADLVDTVNADAVCLFDNFFDPRVLVWNLVELVQHLEEYVAVAQATDPIVDERTGLAFAEASLFEATMRHDVLLEALDYAVEPACRDILSTLKALNCAVTQWMFLWRSSVGSRLAWST